MNIAVTLDLNKPDTGQRIRLRRGEVNSTVLSFVVNEGGVRVDLTAFTEILFCAQKDDGIIIDNLTATDEGDCMYSLPASLASIAGEVRLAYLELRKENYRATTNAIIFDVLEAVNDKEIEATYVPKLDEMIDEINEFRAEVEAEEAIRKSNEEARVEAEKGRVSAESKRVEAESGRVTAESGRVTAESARVTAETGRASAETVRDNAEDDRVAAEVEREKAEGLRASTFSSNEAKRQSDFEAAEKGRAAAEATRQTNETTRQTNESARVQAENKRQADFAEIVDAAQGFKTQILTAGEYDPDTLEPTITGNPGIIYLVPVGTGATDDDHYKEFLYLSNAWEYIGTTETTITPISTDTIDEIVAETTKTGSETLNTTGLSYFFSSLWAKAKGAFADIAHKHAATDITSGTLDDARLPVVPVSKGGTGATTANEAANNLAVYSIGYRQSLALGTDLNTVVEVGNYCAEYNNLAATLLNCPVASAFVLTVFETTGRNSGVYLAQELKPFNSSRTYSRRTSTGGTFWGAWMSDFTSSDTILIPNGGTGAITAGGARKNLLSGLKEETGNVSDGMMMLGVYLAEAQDPIYKRTFLTVWNYIASKIAANGSTGQLLTKTADSFAWADAPDGLPEGGTAGQVLTKTDSGADWLDVPEVPETQMQAGIIYPYGGDSAAVPYGYLLCDGAAVSRTTYAALFAVVGTAYGEGDGSNTFNLPDLRARMPFGEGSITEDSGAYEFFRGQSGGSVKHSHEYGVSYNEGYGAMLNPFELYDYENGTWQKPTHNGASTTTKPSTISASSSASLYEYENYGNTNTEIGMPPFAVVNYIISTGMTGSQAEALANITIGTEEAPATGVPGSIYIQML